MKRLLMIAVLIVSTFATATAASARPVYYGGGYRGYYGGGYYGAYAPRATYSRGAYGPGYGGYYGYYGGPRAYARPYAYPYARPYVYGYRAAYPGVGGFGYYY